MRKFMPPGPFALLLGIAGLSLSSCEKVLKPVAATDLKNASVHANGLAIPNLNLPSVNFFEALYYYAGYYGPSAVYTQPNPQYQAAGYKILSDAAANGIKAIRFFAAGSYSESQVDFPVIELWKSNRTAFYQAFDKLVSDANSLGIQLIPSLVTGFFDGTELAAAGTPCNIPAYLSGSIPFMPTLSKNVNGACKTYNCLVDTVDCKNRTGMIQYALDIVGRYSNSSTILFWEIANELNLIRQSRNPDSLFVTQQQIADYVNMLSQKMKAIDPSHLICPGIINEQDGAVGDFSYYYGFYYGQMPYTDIATVHLYDGSTNTFLREPVASVLQTFNNIAIQDGKTMYIGEYGLASSASWTGNNFNNFVMSLLMAKTYLGIPLASAWTWESKSNGYNVNGNHPEMLRFSIDPGVDNDLISVIKWNDLHMWNNAFQPSTPIVGDFDGDHHTDFGVMTQRGLFDIALMNNNAPSIPSQWISNFGDSVADPGGATWRPITGDWNGDGKTDIGLKSKDGRWFVAYSNYSNSAAGQFNNAAQVLSNFGNENADPGGAPFLPFTGDWNHDGYTDIGMKSKDGRWFVAFADPIHGGFINPAQWLSNFGDDDTDPGGAPFTPITGDWNHDGYTDIGVRSKDGRWFVAFANPSGGGFINPAQWLSGFGDDYSDPGGAPFFPITGDWNGDGYTDIGLKSSDGRWFVAFTSPSGGFINQAQWLSNFGNNATDPGGAPFIPITGDWNGDGKTDIGLKAFDGRWFTYQSTGSSFNDPLQLFQSYH